MFGAPGDLFADYPALFSEKPEGTGPPDHMMSTMRSQIEQQALDEDLVLTEAAVLALTAKSTASQENQQISSSPASHIVLRIRRKPKKKFRRPRPIKLHLPEEVRLEDLSRSKPRKLLPMTPLAAGYQIRFEHKCMDLLRTEETPGCPTVMHYRNGDRRVVYSTGADIIFHGGMKLVRYPNKDRSCQFSDGAVAYRFEETGTLELTLPDQSKITQFSSGRREAVDAAGRLTVTFHSIRKVVRPKKA
jgi:hypothetical protein